VTSNDRKLGEARLALKDFDVAVNNKRFDIDEIQASDPIVIAKHKAKEAFKLAKEPIVITDTSWCISALNGFPGGYMKDVENWFKPADFINLLKSYDDKSISFTETIVYQDSNQTKVFSQTFLGRIADKPRGTGNSIEQLAEFDGFTIGERHQQGRFSHDPKDYVWYQFAQWFVGLI
jgi:non-canonical purine NTP pyrophosphatase (RdgB/HAM1 family)